MDPQTVGHFVKLGWVLTVLRSSERGRGLMSMWRMGYSLGHCIYTKAQDSEGSGQMGSPHLA